MDRNAVVAFKTTFNGARANHLFTANTNVRNIGRVPGAARKSLNIDGLAIPTVATTAVAAGFVSFGVPMIEASLATGPGDHDWVPGLDVPMYKNMGGIRSDKIGVIALAINSDATTARVLGVFESTRLAEELTGIDRTSISDVITAKMKKGKIRTFAGQIATGESVRLPRSPLHPPSVSLSLFHFPPASSPLPSHVGHLG